MAIRKRADNMEQRRVVNPDVFVRRLGLGCVTFGREIDEAASFRLLDQAACCFCFLDSGRQLSASV